MLGITVAAVLSCIIGYERETRGQLAGIRTHVILCVGAALASSLSISFSKILSSPELPSDPARIVAQVVSGVGFLGGGAILRYGVNIKGLTTASSLWTTAIIGIACGAGFYTEACFASAVVLTALTLVDTVVRKTMKTYTNHEITLRVHYRPDIIKDMRNKLLKMDCRVMSTATAIDKEGMLKVTVTFAKPKDLKLDAVISMMQDLNT